MSDEQKYTIQGLDEYIRQGEPQQRERSEAWKVAIGLQQVDRLQTSEYLLDTLLQDARRWKTTARKRPTKWLRALRN